MLLLGPLFLYGTVVDPWLVRDSLWQFFRDTTDLRVVFLLNFLCVTAMTLGVLHRDSRSRRSVYTLGAVRFDTRTRVHLVRIAVVLAATAGAAYAYGIANAGGLVAAFLRRKGGGTSGYGYVNEAMNLGLAAAAMVALSRARRGWTLPTAALLVCGLLPNLIQGTLGGRRGPLAFALLGLLVASLIAARRRPKVVVVGAALSFVAFAITLVWSQRHSVYLGSEQTEVNWSEFEATLTQAEVDSGNNFIYASGFVISSQKANEFTWACELAVNLLIRPIPRQLWPTKYEDVGATWITNEYPGLGHLQASAWLDAVGWLPPAGSSGISISDLFGEFSWGTVLVMYLVGQDSPTCNGGGRASGGVWILLHFEALIVSIHLATQSFSAFYYRFLILAVPTVIVYRLYVENMPSARSLSRDRYDDRSLCLTGSSRVSPHRDIARHHGGGAQLGRHEVAEAGTSGTTMQLVAPDCRSQRRVLVAQIGARRHDAVPRALQRCGVLQSLVTDACAVVQPWSTLEKVLPRAIQPQGLRAVLDRRVDAVERSQVRGCSGMFLASRLHRSLRRAEPQVSSWVRQNRAFGRAVSRLSWTDVNTVYAFNGAALEIFERANRSGITCVLDQTAAPWRFNSSLLELERRRWPGWEDSPVDHESAR